MFNPSISKATTMTLSLVLPLLVVGLLLLGLPALTEARELDPPPPAPAVDALSPLLQSTVGATFTYQGRLLQGSDAVSGTCNLTFALFDSLSGGSQVGSDFTNSSIAVQDGYFTQDLNFGDTAFDGDARWLEITINSCNGGGSSATLSPRVAVTAAPYAMHADQVPWSGVNSVPGAYTDVSGTYPNLTVVGLQTQPVSTAMPTAGQVLQWDGSAWAPGSVSNTTTYSAGVGLALNDDTFSLLTAYALPQSCATDEIAAWNGSAWVCASPAASDTLAALSCAGGEIAKWSGSAWMCATDANTDTTYSAGDGLALNGTTFSVDFAGSGSLTTTARSDHNHNDTYWSLSGNSGTGSDDFVGTTDNMTLTLKVNDTTGLRLIPGGAAGDETPNVIGGWAGNMISDTMIGSVIGGGGTTDAPNQITHNFATISGGRGNTAAGMQSTIAGGIDNQASGNRSTVGGGRDNTAGGTFAVVAGGQNNKAITGTHSTVSGGYVNEATANYATVGGGYSNNAADEYATVGGGESNSATGAAATVGGGRLNEAVNRRATVGGGYGNNAAGEYATVGGGYGNNATADSATVGGGDGNNATADSATVGGGSQNEASANYATVGGGNNNETSAESATVSGGEGNTASGGRSTVGGGYSNEASGNYASVVAGGFNNTAGTDAATVSGGQGNKAITGTHTTVGGGSQNEASGNNATVSGGYQNEASGDYATVAGGQSNEATGNAATVGGGNDNWATVANTTVGGGQSNRATERAATVSGGGSNSATAVRATIPGGYQAQASHYGEMAYASGQFSAQGDAQTSLYVLRNTTSDDTATELFLNGTDERLTIADDRVVAFDILVVGTRVTENNDGDILSAGYQIRGVIQNHGGFTTQFIGSPQIDALGTNTIGWNVNVQALPALNVLRILVTGGNSSIRWVATVRTVEVGF